MKEETAQISALREITKTPINGLEDNRWERIEMAVDSGASAIVIGEDDLSTIQAVGANPDIHYEKGGWHQNPTPRQ